MARYHVIVFETRTVEMLYTVEADDPEHAEEMAAIGNTVEEELIRELGVTERQPDFSARPWLNSSSFTQNKRQRK